MTGRAGERRAGRGSQAGGGAASPEDAAPGAAAAEMRMIGLVLSGLAPLKMMMVARMGAKRRAELAASAVDAIAGEGPDSLIGDAKRDPRVRGRVLGELAAGLAELAFRPGGVDLFGEHFCADGCGRAQSPACAARGRGAAGGAR